MSSSTPSVCAEQAIYAKSQTIRQGKNVAVSHICRWLTRPTPTPQGWGGGRLIIDGTSYTADATFATADNGAPFLYVRLVRWDGKEIVVCVGQGVEQCSCEHYTYRGVTCKHIASLQQALEQLELLERLEWELSVAEKAIDGILETAPF